MRVKPQGEVTQLILCETRIRQVDSLGWRIKKVKKKGYIYIKNFLRNNNSFWAKRRKNGISAFYYELFFRPLLEFQWVIQNLCQS